MSLILKKVDEDNYREIVSLKVAKGQETFIESTQECLDEAKELSLWRTVGVYDKNTLIGFAMYGFFESEGVDGRVWLDRFMIGHEHQGKGYSNRSLNLLISHISKEYNCEEIFLSVYDDNTVAIKIYEKLGFKFNGEVDTKGEKIMVIELSKDNMQIKIRKELEKDFNTVETIVEEAFKNAEFSDHSEHELVGRLRKSNEFINELSLVAKVNEEIVGHILLTKIKIKNDLDSFDSLALAPVAVLPKYQGMKIGKKLIETALDKAKELGFGSVIVLGHAEYYPKFGFEISSKFDIKAPFEVPEEAFMVIQLKDDSLKGVSGVVEYSSAFLDK